MSWKSFAQLLMLALVWTLLTRQPVAAASANEDRIVRALERIASALERANR